MSGGERPIGAAKGQQSDTEALCQTPPSPLSNPSLPSPPRQAPPPPPCVPVPPLRRQLLNDCTRTYRAFKPGVRERAIQTRFVNVTATDNPLAQWWKLGTGPDKEHGDADLCVFEVSVLKGPAPLYFWGRRSVGLVDRRVRPQFGRWDWGRQAVTWRGGGGSREQPPRPPKGFLKELDFFLLRTARRDRPKGPSTANHQPPPTANRRQPPAATNRQPPTANHCQPPSTPPRVHQLRRLLKTFFGGFGA